MKGSKLSTVETTNIMYCYMPKPSCATATKKKKKCEVEISRNLQQ